jgi:ABC-type multidrug transport system fused ATPase/permease subunit
VIDPENHTMKIVKYTNRLIRVTLPIVLPIAKRYKSKLFLLLLFSVILGFLPSIKSGIESNFLNEANNIITPGNSDTIRSISFSSVFNHRFNEKKESGFFDNLPNYFTNGYSLWTVVLIYLFAIVITIMIEYSTEKVKTFIGRDIFVAIREASFKKVLNTNPSDMPKILNSSGNFSSSIQIGTGNISRVYKFIASFFQYLFLLVTSLVVLFTKAWLFGMLFILVLSVQVLLSLRRARKLKSDRNELEKSRNNLIGQTEDIISKKEIILAFEQGERYNSNITKLSFGYGELSRRLDLRDFIYISISKIINEIERFLIPLLALLFIVFFDSTEIKNVGGIFFLITLYIRLGNPILSILSQYDSLRENEAISNSLLDLLEISNDEKKASADKSIKEINDAAIAFENVTFSYDNTKEVLKDCSFTIPKNQTTIILGPSGCGKSSIAKIILGFWPISKGEVFLMGQRLTSYSDKEIRLFSSYISQGNYIVEDTIRDNLNWGMNSAQITDEMMMQALLDVKLVNQAEDSSILDRYSKDLSGGEQQRLSLARIILDNSPLLILDEPLTGVDVYTIKDIIPTFKKILQYQNRTVILISHKLSFVNSADYLILLNKEGEIIEKGTPEDLFLIKTSVFFNLYDVAIKELSFENKNKATQGS